MRTASWRAWSCRVDVTVAGGVGDDIEATTLASSCVRAVMDDVAAAVSRFGAADARPSDLQRINAAAGRRVPVSALTSWLVRVALDAARATGGAVDPTVGRAVIDAGYDRDIEEVRQRSGFQSPGVAIPAAGWRTVRTDERLSMVGVPKGVVLDLGATAKAWAVDEAARVASSRLGLPVLVGIGGDLATAGQGAPWLVRVGERETGPAQQVSFVGGGMATSSTAVRSWATDHGPAHHLIDPATGEPARGPYRTVTVWAPTCVDANTLSTAALVWGGGAPERLAAAGASARLVSTDGRVSYVGAWPRSEEAA